MILSYWVMFSVESPYLCKSGCTLSLQVAMVQFTDDPRTEFKLDAYKTKETLLDAIRHISYKGGNTKTGKT